MKPRQSINVSDNEDTRVYSFFKSILTLFPFVARSSKNKTIKKLDATMLDADRHSEIAESNKRESAELDKKVAYSIRKADEVLAERQALRNA